MIGAQVLSSLKWLTSAHLAGKGLATVISIIVIRLLEPSDYGLMAMAIVFLGLIQLLNEMGLGAALIQQQDLERREMEQVFGLLLVVNVALYAAVYTAAPLVAIFFKEPRVTLIIQVLALRLPLTSLMVVPRAILLRNMRFRAKSIVDFAGMISASAATLTFALLGHGVWSLVYGSLFGAFVDVAGIYIASRILLRPRFSLRGMRRQATFGGFVTMDSILWYVYTQSDTVIVGRLLGNEALGFYHVAKKLASLPLDKLGGIIRQVGFSAYSRVQSDRKALRSHYCKAARMASLFGFPVCFGISAIAPDAVPLILGSKWTDSVLTMQLVALIVPLRQLNVLNSPALLGVGRPEVNVVNLIFALSIMPAAFFVGSRWGVSGVALAWVLAYPFYFVIMLSRSLPVLGIPFNDYFDSVWPPAIAATVMYGLVALTSVGLAGAGTPAVPALVLAVVVGALAFFGAISLIRRSMVREALAFVRR